MAHLTIGLMCLMWAHPAHATANAPQAPAPDVAQAWQAQQQRCAPTAGQAPAQELACSQATQALLDAAAAAHWPGAWAYSAVLAEQSYGERNPKRALQSARAAQALHGTSWPAAQALVRALWQTHAYSEGVSVAVGVLYDLVLAPPAPTGLGALWGYGLVISGLCCFAATVVWALVWVGPQLGHDVAHGLPKVVRPGVVPVLAAAMLLALAWGPPSPMVMLIGLCYSLLLHLGPTMRQRLAHCALALGLLVALLPAIARHAAFMGTPQGARCRALVDGNAQWARARLPVAERAGPMDAWAQALLARRDGDPAAARALMARALAADEVHPSWLIVEGNLLWEQGDFARAKAFYEQAIALWPDDAVAHYNLSLALLSLAEPRAADAARRRAFALGGAGITARAAHAQAVGLLLLDPELPSSLLVDQQQGPAAPALLLANAALGKQLLAPLSLMGALWALFGLALAHGLMTLGTRLPAWGERFRQRLPVTGRCSRCQALSCPRCAKEAWEAGLCARCQQAALGSDEAALRVRGQQEAQSLRHHRMVSVIAGLGAWGVVGLGPGLRRSWPLGLALAIAFGGCLQMALWGRGMVPVPFSLGLETLATWGQPLWMAAAACAASLWLFSVALSRQER